MKIAKFSVALFVLLLAASVAEATPTGITFKNISGQVSGGVSLEGPDDIYGVFATSPVGGAEAGDEGGVSGGFFFDPTTGLGSFGAGFGDIGFVNEADPGSAPTVMLLVVSGGFGGPLKHFPLNTEATENGFFTITGKIVVEDLEGLDEVFTFTEPASFSATFDTEPDGLGEWDASIVFGGTVPTPEPSGASLALIGTIFIGLFGARKIRQGFSVS